MWVDVPLSAEAVSGTVVADLSMLVAKARLVVKSACTVLAQPRPAQSVDKPRVSYLRLATSVYSALVSAGVPQCNVLVVHPRCLQYVDALRCDPGSTTLCGRDLPNCMPNDCKARREDDVGNGRDSLCVAPTETDETQLSVSIGNDDVRDIGLYSVVADSTGYTFGDGNGDIFGRFNVVAVGGTFDRLHAGHRLLLSAAAWASAQKLWIGVTGEALLGRKQYADLIAPYEDRAKTASAFARQIRPDLPTVSVSELTDSAGATGRDPSIDAIVVSCETRASADGINATRVRNGLPAMTIITVDVLAGGSSKLSSSALREADAKSFRSSPNEKCVLPNGAEVS